MAITDRPLVRTQAELDQCPKEQYLSIQLLGRDIEGEQFSLHVPEGSHYVVRMHGGGLLVTGHGKLDVHGAGRVVVNMSERAVVTAHGQLEVDLIEVGKASVSKLCDVVVRNNVHVLASGNCLVLATDHATVVARGHVTVTATTAAKVVAYDSVSVDAGGYSRVEATGTTTITASGSSAIIAAGNTYVTAFGATRVRASAQALVRDRNSYGKITTTSSTTLITSTGTARCTARGVYTSSADWCEKHGVTIADDNTVVLYKAVNKEFISTHHALYKPGSWTVAHDWDGTFRECGGGLHFSARPFLALGYHGLDKDNVRFVACRVRVDQIANFREPSFPDKVKAEMCFNLYECDLFGNQLGQRYLPEPGILQRQQDQENNTKENN